MLVRNSHFRYSKIVYHDFALRPLYNFHRHSNIVLSGSADIVKTLTISVNSSLEIKYETITIKMISYFEFIN